MTGGLTERIRRAALRSLALTLLAATALAITACASSDDDDEGAPARPQVTVPQATTQTEWMDRLVTRFLFDMNENLRVVNSLGNPQIQVYLRSGNETTANVLRRRMTDLGKCSQKLARVGPPPQSRQPLDRIFRNFRRSCPPYERLARHVLASIPLLTSGDPDAATRGEEEFAKASEPSRLAARWYGEAVELLESRGLLDPYQS